MNTSFIVGSLLLLLTGCGLSRASVTAGGAQSFAGQVVIDSAMLAHLEILAETASVEPARCIAGAWVDERFELQAALDMPYLVIATQPDMIAWAWWNCPAITTVALWHGHLWNYWWRRGALTPPRGRCLLSPQDRAVALDSRAPALHFISVKRGVSCMWFRRGKELIPIPIRREGEDQ